MTADCNKIQSVLLRSGTDQIDRLRTDLDPGSVTLHGFGIEEWMAFAYNFATHVNYFDESNWQIPEGDWQAFFKNEAETIELLKELEESDELTPHLTLFICFLKLIELSAERMNGLTKRHLDFFYQDILQISKLPAVEDKVHILFELSKNTAQAKLEEGRLLNAGKDKNGKARSYAMAEEFVANQAKIVQLKNVYFDPDYTDPVTSIVENRYYMKAADVANSADGKGDSFNDEKPTWYAFGYNHNRTDSRYAELDNARLGFAVSSKVLSLSEGTRHVQIEVTFVNSISGFTDLQLLNAFNVFYTDEKEWVGPLALQPTSAGTSAIYKTELVPAAKMVRFYVKIDSGKSAVTDYNKKVHGETYTATNPVFRFVLKSLDPNVLAVYRALSKQIRLIDIKVEAQEMKNLVLENDHGTLNPKKPLYPFTTVPVKGSNFNVAHAEIFAKKWDGITLTVNWKNVPDSLVNHYAAYEGPYRLAFSQSAYETSELTLFRSSPGAPYSVPIYNLTNKIVTSPGYFDATQLLKYDNNWINIASGDLFTTVNPYQSVHTFLGGGYQNGKVEYVRLSLNQSFLHEMYPRLYAVSLKSLNLNVVIPNEPYTPFAEDIMISYTAHESLDLTLTNQSDFDNRGIQLFHEHPFGQAEENAYLKSLLNFVNNSCTLIPSYCRGGEFYIGIEKADQLQNISLLIQLFEGSENPLTSSFIGNQGVTWDILSHNHWKPLDKVLLRKNEIDNFLQSGLIEFKIPKEATSENTVLSGGLFWIRAKMLKPYDAVCRVLGIHAQAALAEFNNNNNDLSHLEKGLPAETISKLLERSAQFKSIVQPYNSFGGAPEESEEKYYKRVSERLRHKNRSITLWDYEHMVLQEFPEIYNVKCLNHTNENSFTAAGHVTLVVIPDTINKNVYDIYQPRVSTAFLNRIKTYIDQFNSLHVKQYVINPTYEPITIDLKVKFYPGFDEALYKIQLNEDITKLLSPWAFDRTVNVEFGNTLHRSVLIEYIEGLHYVDYVQDVLMLTSTGTAIQNYTPSSPKAIMVSVKNHIISTDIITCESTINTVTEECQQ